MKPVDQEYIHDPVNGSYGDCQRAVIASLLELPISEVPHFLVESKGDTDEYWDLLQAFLGKRGYVWMTLQPGQTAMAYGEHNSIYHEIAGPSPRGNGITHAVVGLQGQVFFDPHPSRAGLVGDPALWQHSFLLYAGGTVK